MPLDNTHPFAALNRKIEGSRLGMAAAAKNLNAVATREQLRSRGAGTPAAAPTAQSAVAISQVVADAANTGTPSKPFAGLRAPSRSGSPMPAPTVAAPEVKPASALPTVQNRENVSLSPANGVDASDVVAGTEDKASPLLDWDLLAKDMNAMAQTNSPQLNIRANVPASSSGFGTAPASTSGFSSTAAKAPLSEQDIEDAFNGLDGAAPAPARGGFSGGGFSGGSGFSTNARPAAAPEKKLIYTEEQNRIIHCEDRLIVADAFAGCAKTTTAIAYARHRPHTKMLYICLNKANQLEAEKRFPANVDCLTTHALAYRAIRPDRTRVEYSWRPMLLMDQLRVPNARMANNVMRVLGTFFASTDAEIGEQHVQELAEERDLNSFDADQSVALAAMAWKRMNTAGDSMKFPPDAYLKMFALRAPQLTQYKTIICDEWQDANPVTAQIVAAQKHTKLVCIGDRHQSIYQFRGSINAMEKFSLGATKFHLSQTFRFGPKIADLANLVLSEFKGETVPIRGMGRDGVWKGDRITTLSRTNAELFRLAAPRRGEGVHWVGGYENQKTGEWVDGCHGYRLEAIEDAYNLYARNRSAIKNEMVRTKFATWDDFVKYGKDGGDSEVKIVVKIVEEHQHDIPELVSDIKSNAVRTTEAADLTLTTGHKAKGLEWDYVRISDDFEVFAEAEEKRAQFSGEPIDEQSINLAYVSFTRAKLALQPNKETVEWLQKLPEHRKNRDASAARHEADMARLRAQTQHYAATSSRPPPEAN